MSEVAEKVEFVIDDDVKADWALERIAEERAEAERLKAVCQARIEEFEQRIEAIDKRCENNTGYLIALLSDYFASVPHKATKTQETYALPSGKLVYKRPGKTAVRDDNALLAWAKANAPEFIQTTEKAQWASLKKELAESGDHYIYKATGEVVEGVHLEETPGKFDVTI